MADFFSTTPGILLLIVGQSILVVAFVMLSMIFLVYGDRKIWAAVQLRRGPNVVGPWGILQTFADALKFVLKEIVVPAGADKFVFFLAPMLSFVLAVLGFAVIPFADGWVLSDINVAILFIFAISSLEVYGVIMGGWASNSKYPFLASLRAAAQMISYEVSLGLIIIGIIISTGSMNLSDIVRAQDGSFGIFNWYWLPHLPMVVLFFISALAETNRPPFDLAEAESELVAGHMVEYSSTLYLLFMAGEYTAIWLMCALLSLLFFGGWLSPIPGLPVGARHDRPVLERNLGAEHLERPQVQIHRTLADRASARQADARFPEAGEQRSEREHRGSHTLHQLVRRLEELDVRGRDLQRALLGHEHAAADILEQPAHRDDVANVRQIVERDGVAGQQCCGEAGQRRVLRSADLHPSREWASSDNSKLVHGDSGGCYHIGDGIGRRSGGPFPPNRRAILRSSHALFLTR